MPWLTENDVENFIIDSSASDRPIYSIAAPTGTGKSTIFPITFYKKRKTTFIVCPTIMAAQNLANKAKTLVPPQVVGTALDREIKYDNKFLNPRSKKTTPLVYCTSGHLRNILLKMAEKPRGIKFADYIMLDEAHTGNMDYDLIMYLYKYLLDLGESLPQLILVTATPAKYPFKKEEIFVATYQSSSYPVQLYYHRKDYDSSIGAQRVLYTDLGNLVAEWHKARPVADDEVDGWLVFCPGKEEISRVMKILEENTEKTLIMPAYASLGPDQQDVNQVPPFGFRKIVVATNVAEASITIEGLSGVFDCTFEKILEASGNGGTMLSTVHIAKSSADQRKGRAGRTRSGFCYRMCTEKTYKTFEISRQREIERIPPDRLILDLISRGLEIEKVIFDGAISKEVIVDVKERLELIGLLAASGRSVTEAGRFVQDIPLSPRMGMFYWLWKNAKTHSDIDLPVFVGATIASVIDAHAQGYLFIPREPTIDKDEYIKDNFGRYRSKSGLRVVLKIFNDFFEYFQNFKPDPRLAAMYSMNHSLNNQRLKDATKNMKALLEKTQGVVEIGTFNVDKAVDAAMPFFVQVYRDLIFPKGSKDHNIQIDRNLTIPSLKNYIIPMIQMGTSAGKYRVSLYESVDDINVTSIIPRSMSYRTATPVTSQQSQKSQRSQTKKIYPGRTPIEHPKQLPKTDNLPESGDPVYTDSLQSIYANGGLYIDSSRKIWIPTLQEYAYAIPKTSSLENFDPSEVVDVDGILFNIVN
jgi:HrpA-like RNA helicase